LLVFGIRGCLPINYSGTGLADSHFVKFNPPNYLTMMCTIGLWRPGKGFALFPGSTVPYGPDVNRKASGGGDGVNQLGRGRYQKYFPGWHTSTQKEAGHWALRQGGPITLQRTSDAYPYDLLDKWQEGTIAGDNIHCARSMGPEGRIPESKYSSLGCQVVAGTVIDGDHFSEAGPWAIFIANFKGADAPKSVDYVLFDGAEVERMITDQNIGSSIILRFGSVGAHVAALQTQLAGALNRPISVDADFGVKTFRALIDFQEEVFGPAADDGIVGRDTAKKLGFELPIFDFKAVISGNEETTVITKSSSVELNVDEGRLKPKTDNPLLKKHFSKFSKRPSNANRRKIYDIYLDYFKTPECWFWLEEFGIGKTPKRLAHFFAQAAHETGGFTITRENMRYTSVSAVKKAFGSRVRRKKYSDARIKSELLENPKAMAKWAYNGRGGNQSGTDDGYNFRGGGIFQTTHRTGYRSVEKELKKYGILVPLEQDPSLIVDPRVSFPAACFEWKHLGGNELADANNIKAISRGLNRGKSKMHGSTPANGEADRIAKYKKTDKVFSQWV
jgi:predicted chitinase